MDFVVGFDPHPIKLGWSVVGLAALIYALVNLMEAHLSLRWATDPDNHDAYTPGRVTVAEGYLLIHRILVTAAVLAFLLGLASVFSPPNPTERPEHITLGFLVAIPGLFGIETGIAAVSWAFHRMQGQAQSLARRHVSIDIHPTASTPTPTQLSSSRTLTAHAQDPTGALDVRVDVEVGPKE